VHQDNHEDDKVQTCVDATKDVGVGDYCTSFYLVRTNGVGLRFLLLILVTCNMILLSCGKQQEEEGSTVGTSTYKIDLKLDPAEQFLDVQCSLMMISPADSLMSLEFCLHRQFNVHDVTGNNLSSYVFDTSEVYPLPYVPEGRVLTLNLSEPLYKGQQTAFEFRYSGYITAWPQWLANVVTEDWVELGLYLPWFPYNHEYGDFTFAVEVDCDTAYRIRSFGSPVRSGNKRGFQWPYPVNDIVLVASRDLKTESIQQEGRVVKVHYVTVGDSTAHRLANDLSRILNTYESWFGSSQLPEVTLIQSAREKGGGYARPGLIVLGGLEDQAYADKHEGWFRYISHEAGHLWWHGAPVDNWEDWLNESFAEYSALLAVREVFGEQSFQRRLDTMRKKISGTRPIWGINREGSSVDESREIEIALYSKGPVLLNELSEKIGNTHFLALCREMVCRDVASTRQMLALLEEHEGKEISVWFEEMLKTR